MRPTIATLTLAYVLSQFYRAFLAVLAPVLAKDLGTPAEVLAQASGWWFLAFAAMQLPVGWALDRFGPRVTVSGLMAVAALGAALFAAAQGPLAIDIAMLLIGVGCAPVLMGAYYILAREFPPKAFGTLAGMVIGVGSLGNIAASAPLGYAAAALGWRGAIAGLAGITLAAAVVLALIVRDPPKAPPHKGGSILTLLAMPRLWPVMLMMAACYAPAAGLRGLWTGPYVADVFSADAGQVGLVTLVMGLAMVAGNFAYGPLERVLHTRKWLNFTGNALLLACLAALALHPVGSLWTSAALLAGVGFFGSTFPMVMAHGRAFMPPALVGRGVTLMNLFGIGMAGLMQMATGRLHGLVAAPPPEAPYAALFWFYAALVAAGLAVYVFSQDRTD
jgi:predicted MFS family arabinose efflux permease